MKEHDCHESEDVCGGTCNEEGLYDWDGILVILLFFLGVVFDEDVLLGF